MFSVTDTSENDFKKLILEDTGTGTRAELIPACGAALHAFSVLQHGLRLNLIDHYTNAGEFKEELTQNFKSSKLSPFVCRLMNGSYSFGGSLYKTGKFYNGRHALHGLLYDAVFLESSRHADEKGASVIMKHEYRKNDAGYPFNYDCIVTYELSAVNKLCISTEIINRDDGLIPVGDGWHPYFRFGKTIDELQLEFQSTAVLEFDEDLLPTGLSLPYEEFTSLKKIGDTSFDNCFVLDLTECQPLCVLRDPAQKIQVEIQPDTAYPYLQIYTPPHRKSIAIENLSSAPDAFNNGIGLRTLFPGAAARFTTTYRIRSLP